MAILSERSRVGCYIISEAGGETGGMRSRDVGTLLAGTKYAPGQLLGFVTASEKYAPLNAAGADGTENATAICFGWYDATAADYDGAVLTVRETEANGLELVWPNGISDADKTAAIADLAALGIIVR
ncbi:head decoration protein [Breoghania sp.]|uniref:head decoration protein n=1 Tax=Breoghania sp. TaxID=2065378 RepID=UPI002AA91FA9|nr:head decoration protein [Breoghania sp.]